MLRLHYIISLLFFTSILNDDWFKVYKQKKPLKLFKNNYQNHIIIKTNFKILLFVFWWFYVFINLESFGINKYTIINKNTIIIMVVVTYEL